MGVKVFYAMPTPWVANPFVSTLLEEISNSYSDIEFGWGSEAFWIENIISNYDIIHFQWPTDIFHTQRRQYNNEDLRKWLLFLKRKGKKIVATCHNFQPHYSTNTELSLCYSTVYQLSDTIIHLGEYSQKLFQELYPKCNNVLIPHHIYDTYFTDSYSKDESCQKLHLNPNYTYILCMGTFRDSEERDLILHVAEKVKRRATILAPSFIDLPTNTKLQRYRRRATKYLLRNKYRIIATGQKDCPVPDSDIPYYYGVADFCIIPRLKNLNSGVLPLAMLMGKAVIGPSIGNIGPLLDTTGNLSFNPGKPQTLVDAVKKYLSSDVYQIGHNNKQYAFKYFNTHGTAEKLHSLYSELGK